MFPCFQFLPLELRAWLLQRRDLGWYTKAQDRQTALSEVSAIRLLSKREIRVLFPEATIFEERLLGLVKSFVAYTRIQTPATHPDHAAWLYQTQGRQVPTD